MSRIGIIGAGNVGGVLAKRLVALGHAVKIANSRGPETMRDLELDTGANAVKIDDVCADIDIVIISIPFGRTSDLRPLLGTFELRGVTIIDTGNYIPQRDGSIAAIDAGLAETAWISRQLDLSIVKTFNSITTYSLEHRGRPTGAPHRIAMPVAGDDLQKKAAAIELLEQLGFDGFDAGPLADSWRQQPGQPAYASDPTLEELPTLLLRADKERGPISRDNGMKLMAKLGPEFPQQELVRVLRFSVGLDRFDPRSWLSMLGLGLTMLRPRGAGGFR